MLITKSTDTKEVVAMFPALVQEFWDSQPTL